MIHLILALLSIGLFSLLMIMGSSEVNVNEINKSTYEREIKSSIATISTSVNGYRLAQRRYPETDEWLTALYPDFGTLPTIGMENGSFSLYEDSNDYFICIEASANTTNKEVFIQMEDKYSGVYMKGTSCGVSDIIDAQNDVIYLSYQL